ncbi:MAG: CinA family protein [Alphaproteobacteria bacterium]|nr:CinA family protein [Alphaproteobacteria bacterium]OIN86456.1 MAG: damage-inducible protein CinA [Alphaproteobacteria bacterium CG1_02_46_17]
MDLSDLVRTLSDVLRTKTLKLVTAESCTGGLISSLITDLAGSSDVLDRGFVTYSNQSKSDMLGVSPLTLDKFGAVSQETATEMARGALERSQADLAISVTGIAGPSGGTDEKPVGLVYIGFARRDGESIATKHLFHGDRQAIRFVTAKTALETVLGKIGE